MGIVEIATFTTRPQVRGKIGPPEAGKPDKGVGGAVISPFLLRVEPFRIIEGDPEGAPTAVATTADVEFAAFDVVLAFDVVERGRDVAFGAAKIQLAAGRDGADDDPPAPGGGLASDRFPPCLLRKR